MAFQVVNKNTVTSVLVGIRTFRYYEPFKLVVRLQDSYLKILFIYSPLRQMFLQKKILGCQHLRIQISYLLYSILYHFATSAGTPGPLVEG